MSDSPFAAVSLPEPFARVAPHFSLPGKGVASWLMDPPGMVTTIAPETFIDAQIARFVSTTVYAAMRQRHATSDRFYFVQDFGNADAYDTEARQIFTDWGRSIIGEAHEILVVMPPGNAVFRMGVSAVMLALRMAGGRMETAKSLDEAVAKFRLRPLTNPSSKL